MPHSCADRNVILRPRPTGFEMSGVGDTVDALDRDHVIINDVHDPVLADSQPVIVGAVEGFRRVRVLSQPDDSHANSAHPVLIFHVAPG